MNKLLVATHNPGKVREYSELLSGINVTWVSLNDMGITTDVEEMGHTYEQNAMSKVEAYGALSGMVTLADDSGIEVDALNGAPGVLSSRYGGVKGRAQHQFLLQKISDVPLERRTARFCCVALLRDRDGQIYKGEGTLEGRIVFEPIGEHGFGYDPLFFVDDYQATLAELSSEIKNKISHRAVALHALRKPIRKILGD